MTLRRGIRRRMLVVCLMLAVAAAGTSYAIEPPPGSRNFTAPGFVPNYFSNEAAPFHGGAAARPAQPVGDQFNAASPPTSRAAAPRRQARKGSVSASRAKHRGKLVRGKRSYSKAGASRQAARAGARRSGKPVAARHAARPAAGKAVAVRGRPVAAQVASHSRPVVRSAR